MVFPTPPDHVGRFWLVDFDVFALVNLREKRLDQTLWETLGQDAHSQKNKQII